MTYTKDRPVKHIKTGNIYYFIDFVVNVTNGEQDGQGMVLYMNEHNELFVRHTGEFWTKFKELNTSYDTTTETFVQIPLRKLVVIDAACEKLHLNPYCINEGADRNAIYSVSLRDANAWGLLE